MAACRDFLDVCNLAFQLQRSPDVDPLVWQLATRIDRAICELDDLQEGETTLTPYMSPYPSLSDALADISDVALLGFARARARVDETVRDLVWCLAKCHTFAANAAEVLGADAAAEADALRAIASGDAFAQVAALWRAGRGAA